jgi:hypothetical protein
MPIGHRPKIKVIVQARDGKDYNLGYEVAGDDLLAKFYQWRRRRKTLAYCRDRMRSLTGTEREEFQREVNKLKEARRG